MRHSEVQFERWGGCILIVGKFVPSLSAVAPPLAGAIGPPRPLFCCSTGLASLLWAAAPVALGYLFAAQIDSLLAALAGAGGVALELVLALFALCVDRTLHDVPLDHELVIYCNCPNEATSGAPAKLLMAKGCTHVRPLQGGLDAWAAAGYPVLRLPLATDVPPGNAVQTAT